MYGRKHLIRMDDAERASLAVAVMTEIELVSESSASGAKEEHLRLGHLRRLRSMLEQLTA